jgi:hypothetical protein
MTSTSQDTRQPACSRTQVRLRVNFGSLAAYGAPRRTSLDPVTLQVSETAKAQGPVLVHASRPAGSSVLRPAARGSHRGKSGLPSTTSTTRPLTCRNEGRRPCCLSDGTRSGPAVGERVCPLRARILASDSRLTAVPTWVFPVQEILVPYYGEQRVSIEHYSVRVDFGVRIVDDLTDQEARVVRAQLQAGCVAPPTPGPHRASRGGVGGSRGARGPPAPLVAGRGRPSRCHRPLTPWRWRRARRPGRLGGRAGPRRGRRW